MATWTFRNRYYSIRPCGYGHYNLNGFVTTNSEIFDWATDDSDPKRMSEARRMAERFVTSELKAKKERESNVCF